MSEYFTNLNQEEKTALSDALALITVLIAGADGSFEQEELEWAEKVTHIRSYKLKGELKSYYESVEDQLMEKIQYFIDQMPSNVGERSAQISERLSDLNPILAKLEPAVGSKLYQGFLSFADHVAKASGGMMGFFSVNAEEAKWIGLPMIQPIVFEGDEEE